MPRTRLGFWGFGGVYSVSERFLLLDTVSAQPRAYRRRRCLELGPWRRRPVGPQQSQLLPKKIEALAGQRVIAVSVGEYHNLVFTADGAVLTWGNGEHGCLGCHGEDLVNQLLPKKIEAWSQGPSV